MREVTPAEFYRVIGPLDVVTQVRGRYTDADYGSNFVMKHSRELVGMTLNYGPSPRYKPNAKYFLAEGR